MVLKRSFAVGILIAVSAGLGLAVGLRWQEQEGLLADGVAVTDWGTLNNQRSVEWKTRTVLDNSVLVGGYASADAGGQTSSNLTLTECFGTLGVWVFDGKGNFTRARTARATITGLDRRTSSGTYTVASNGMLTLRYSDGRVFDGIVVANGDGFFYSNLSEARTVQSGYARRIEEQPR